MWAEGEALAMTGVATPVGGRRRAGYWVLPHFFNWSVQVASDSL